MNVLIVSQHYWPETFRINEVAESLQRAGCHVRVLTGQPNYPEGKVFTGYAAWRTQSEVHPSGYTIHRVPLAPRGTGRAVRLVLNYLSFIVTAATVGLWSLRGKPVDVVFVYGTSPILQAIPAVAIKAVKGARLVTWVQDLWPQSLEVTGFVRNRRALAAVAVVVRWIYRRNDLLLAQSHAFVPQVAAMSGTTPVEYHPNPGELAFSRPDATPSPGLVLDAGFNVVFAGNFGTVQALDTVIEAAELLRGDTGVRFVLIGSGGRTAWLVAEIARRGLTNVVLPGRFPPSAMPAILAQASALLVTLARSDIMAQTVPSKVQAYLAAGRPIVASLDGEGARVVLEAAAGVTCPAEDAQALADCILQLRAAPPAALADMAAAGRRYYELHFDPEVLAHRLAQRFRALIPSGDAARTEPRQDRP